MEQWVTAWAMAHTGAALFALRVENRTCNAKITCPVSGRRLRIALGNHYGTGPVAVARAAVCVNGKAFPVTFAGLPGVVVETGKGLRSDGLDVGIRQGDTVEVRLYFEQEQLLSSGNALLAGEHSSLGDHTQSVPFAGEDSELWAVERRPFPLCEPVTLLSAVDVYSEEAEALAVLGDSNTFNGFFTSALQKLLSERNTAVLNLGISGNRLLRDSGAPALGGLFGRSAQKRLKWDVFEHYGIRTVLLSVGGNDIFQPGTFAADISELCTADSLWEATREMVFKCRERGLRVLGSTLVPFLGAAGVTAEKQKIADAYNQMVRESSVFDGIVDFAALLEDPENPGAYLAEYDSGDHVHFNPAAGARVAEYIASLLFP